MLTARSLARLQAVDPGFAPDGLFKAGLTLPADAYNDVPKRVNFYRALAERVALLPGVSAAGLVSQLPFSFSKSASDVSVEGAPPPKPGEQTIVFTRTADPGYFQAIGARLVRGRWFDARDATGATLAAIVNQAMARRCWPGQDAVGKRFAIGRGGSWWTVVGIVQDLRQTSLSDAPDPEAYMPHAQIGSAAMSIVVRANGDPLRLAPAVRAALRTLDKDLPLSNAGSLVEDVSHSMRARRFSVVLFGAFAVIALLLAAVGIYGVISYSVARRTHEIGVRMALGAQRLDVQWMVLARGLRLTAVGIVVGLALSAAATRLLRSFLYGISPLDPVAFAGAVLAWVLIAMLASYLPARRAARIDPAISLRYE